MNGTINGGMNGTVHRAPRSQGRNQLYLKQILPVLVAAALAGLLYTVASRTFLDLEPLSSATPSGSTGRTARMGASLQENRETVAPFQDPSGSPSNADRSDEGRDRGLEQRALFGEPRPAPFQASVEAIICDSALINGQWVSLGGKVDDHTLVAVAADKVTMESPEGQRRDFSVGGGGGGGFGGGSFGMFSGGMPQGMITTIDGTAGPGMEGGKKGAGETEKTFNAPDYVLAAIKQHAADATIKKLKWNSQRGYYDIETKTADGRDLDMKLDGTGGLQVREEDVRTESLPERVRHMMQEHMGGQIHDPKRWVRDGQTYFSAEVGDGPNRRTVQLSEDGREIPRN